jgi:signal transduction histidine kinase
MAQTQKNTLQNTLDAVAHEIRNPVAAIGGFAHRLASIGGERERNGQLRLIQVSDIRQYSEIIAKESSRLERVLKEIMEYCQDYEPVVADEDLLSILERVLDEFKEVFDREKINVISDFPKKRVLVPADAGGITKVLRQLFRNAVHMVRRAHGTVTVSVQPLSPTKQVSISISNNGRPIPDEIRHALLDSNLTTKTFGSGLRLPMARKIIEAHNGRIEIQAKEGGGNTVELYLPTV